MADLQELFARLKSPPTTASPTSGHGAQSYRAPSVSSPVFSPDPSGPQPHHQSAIMSPNSSTANTPAPEQGSADRTMNLLSLLKFNQPSQGSSVAQPAAPSEPRPSHNVFQHAQAPGHSQSSHARGISASDLVASFMPKQPASPAAHSPALTAPAHSQVDPRGEHAPSTENPQDLLLRLLSQPKPPQSDAASSAPRDERHASATARDSSPAHVFGSPNAAQTSFDPAVTAKKGPIFTNFNPFDQLSAATSRSRTPKPDTQSRAGTPKVELLGHRKDDVSDSQPHESVSEAVSGVGEQVAKEVAETVAQAESKSNGQKGTSAGTASSESNGDVQDAAIETKREPKGETIVDSEKSAAESRPTNETGHENIADSWENVEADDSSKNEGFAVRVYNFPMRPFTSIGVKLPRNTAANIRPDIVMDIARLKKEFDQIDRNLVAASKHFIVYALSRNGGMRLIRQESGEYRQVFQNYKERVFNLSICSSHTSTGAEEETVLGTGVNGTVFWCPSIQGGAPDAFTIDDLDSNSLIFPPAPAHDDNTSGGQLKTRAKTSSRHPEYFAVGRGKSIHIVWPKVAMSAYMNQETRVCNSEKYLEERSLKISTGRAGKDFAFSEDDTVIATLDKAGKIRFWDIRPLTDPALQDPQTPVEPKEVTSPLLTFVTTRQNEKAWPTSLFFVDKERPCSKGIALRYLIVGMKQNHTLQLWDLGLGKAVQEINLPHENESDAICSVAYHPKTGILAVGHPTRNSIYFIHISAPRYNIPGVMSQAKYISALAGLEKGISINKPDATAIMSGIREFSFSSKGQLRSLYMLNEPAGDSGTGDADDAPLFELYVMHSKGVTCLSIRREDLGWTKDSRVHHPINDGEKTGALEVDILRPPAPDSSVSGESVAQAASRSQSVARESSQRESATISRTASQTPEATMRQSTLAKVESKQDAARAAIINGGEKSEKKKKKKRTEAETASQLSNTTRTASASASSYANAAQRAPSPSQPVQASDAKSDAPSHLEALLKQIDDRLVGETQKITSLPDLITERFSHEIGAMQRKYDEDRRVRDAAETARQDAVLRLVSTTLGENVEKSLSRIVTTSIQSSIVPALSDIVSASVDRRLSEVLHSSIQTSLPREIKSTLQPALGRALQEPEVLSVLTSQIQPIIAGAMEAVARSSAQAAAHAASSATERRLMEQLRQAEQQRQYDSAKVDHLSNLVRSLAETVQSMAASQSDFQGRILELQRQIGAERAPSQHSHGASRQSLNTPTRSPRDEEQEMITRLLTEGKYEEGTLMWLHSARQAQLFDKLFVRCNPTYIREINPLIAVTVAVTITNTFDTWLAERLVWLETILTSINPRDKEINEVIPKIMDTIASRLEAAYVHIADNEPGNAILRKISALIHRAKELRIEAEA